MRKIVFSVILFFSLISSVWAVFKPEEYSLIINLAGRQRILTQKMYEGLAGKV